MNGTSDDLTALVAEALMLSDELGFLSQSGRISPFEKYGGRINSQQLGLLSIMSMRHIKDVEYCYLI